VHISDACRYQALNHDLQSSSLPFALEPLSYLQVDRFCNVSCLNWYAML
jgi:hypothetical protein